MEEPEKKRIKLPLDIYKENHEERYKNSLDSNVCWLYDILRIVFRYLNSRDLFNVAMVCRSWLAAANDEKCLRGPHFFRAYPSVYDRINCISIKEFKRNQSKLYFNCIKSEIRKSTIKPVIGFFLLPISNLEKCINILTDYDICELLPKNCKTIMLFANTVILSKYHGYNYTSCEELICALLPQIPNAKIKMVEVTDTSRRNGYKKYRQMIRGASKRDHKMSMCLMIFSNIDGCNMGSEMYSLAQMRLRNDDKNTVFLYNAVVNRLHTYNKEVTNGYTPYCVALLIIGSIRTWSIITNGSQTDEFEEELKLFKKQVKLQKHSVCFMFGCDSLSKGHMSNLERVASFNRLFPKVPLVGCLGCYCTHRSSHCLDHLNSTCEHNCSIMFMILTYG